MSVNTLMIPMVGTGELRPDSWSSSELWRLWSQWVISISPLTHSPWPQDPCPGTQTAGPWFWFHDSFGHYHYKQQIVVTYFGLVCCPHTITCFCQMLLRRRCSMLNTQQYARCLRADILHNLASKRKTFSLCLWVWVMSIFLFFFKHSASSSYLPPPLLSLVPSRQLWSAQKLIFRVLTTMFFLPTAGFHLQSTGGQYLG